MYTFNYRNFAIDLIYKVIQSSAAYLLIVNVSFDKGTTLTHKLDLPSIGLNYITSSYDFLMALIQSMNLKLKN